MDFPTCPDCGQSVIDDEPVACPFCGAAMGKSAGKPAASQAAPASAKQPAAGAPAAAKGGGSSPAVPAKSLGSSAARPAPKPATSPEGKDDFPFGADESVATATPAVPVATKTKTWQVKCPMCETVGFVLPKFAGHPVRCANPKCLVPVFNAPPVPVEKKPVEIATPKAASRSSNMLPLALGTIVIVGGLGGGAYWLATRPSAGGSIRSASDSDLAMMRETDGAAKPAVEGDGNQAPKQSAQELAAIKSRKLVLDMLKLIDDSSLLGGAQNRSKPLCRSLAIEAFALARNIPGAKSQVESFNRVGAEQPSMRCPGWIEICWQELATGGPTAAAKSVERLMADGEKIPKVGRHQLLTGGRAAAVLWAAGKHEAALQMAASHESRDDLGQLAGQMQQALASGRAKIDSPVVAQPAFGWNFPQRVAVAVDLAVRGHAAESLAWSRAQTDLIAKGECLSARYAALLATQQPALRNDVAEGMAALEPTAKISMLSRAAAAAYAAKRSDDGAELLKAADAAYQELPAIPPLNFPQDAKLVKFEFPRVSTIDARLTATLDLLAARFFANRIDDLPVLFDAAVQAADSIAPAAALSKRLSNEADAMGAAKLRDFVKTALKLKAEADVRRASADYRKVLDLAVEHSAERLTMHRVIAVWSARHGLAERAARHAVDRTTSPAERENEEVATPRIAGELEAASNGDAAVHSLLADSLGAPPVPPLRTQILAAASAGQAKAAADVVNPLEAGAAERDEPLLQAIVSLAASGNLESALDVVAKVTDPAFREEAYAWAGFACQSAQFDVGWQRAQQLPQATEKIALCRGMVAAVVRTLPPDAKPPSTTSTTDSGKGNTANPAPK